MSKRRNGNNQSPTVVQDVEYEDVEALESEVENAESESTEKTPEPEKEEKKSFLNAVKGGFKKTGKVLLGVVIGVGGSLAAGYLMSRKDQPAALEEREIEYYDFDDEKETSEEEEYPED